MALRAVDRGRARCSRDGSLYGFMLIGRWPHDTVEWAKFLVLAVRMAAVPGLLAAQHRVPGPRGAAGASRSPVPSGWSSPRAQLLGDHPLRPGQFADPQPPGLIVLHPPSSTLALRPGVRGRLRLRLPARPAAPRSGPPRRLGGGRRRGHGDPAGQPERDRPAGQRRHRRAGHAAGRLSRCARVTRARRHGRDARRVGTRLSDRVRPRMRGLALSAMGHVELAGIGYDLPDGRPLLDDVSFRVGRGRGGRPGRPERRRARPRCCGSSPVTSTPTSGTHLAAAAGWA